MFGRSWSVLPAGLPASEHLLKRTFLIEAQRPYASVCQVVNINQGRNKVRPKEAAECHCAPIVSGMLIDARMRIKHPSGSRQRGMQAHPGYPWLASPRHNLVPGAVQEKQDRWFVHLAWTQHVVGSARGRIANSTTYVGKSGDDGPIR